VVAKSSGDGGDEKEDEEEAPWWAAAIAHAGVLAGVGSSGTLSTFPGGAGGGLGFTVFATAASRGSDEVVAALVVGVEAAAAATAAVFAARASLLTVSATSEALERSVLLFVPPLTIVPLFSLPLPLAPLLQLST
jgi:hypothetical protein